MLTSSRRPNLITFTIRVRKTYLPQGAISEPHFHQLRKYANGEREREREQPPSQHTQCRMNQPTRLQHVYGSIFRPPIQLVPIDALVSRGVRDGDLVGGAPFESDEADVTVAYGALAEEIETML